MSFYNFPDQTIPENQKNEAWHRQHILGYVSYTGSREFSKKKEEMHELYCAAYATMSEKQKKIIKATITERCGENFGPEYVVYPLIEQKIEKLVGQYRKRPLKRKLMANNPDAVVVKLDKKYDMLAEQLVREQNEMLQENLGFTPQTESGGQNIPENIEEFFAKNYRTKSEEVGEIILKQILMVRKEKEKIYDALTHFLITGSVWGVVDEKDGHPSVLVPSNMEIDYDYDPHDKVQRDAQYFCLDRFMPINDIFNTFDLTETQKTKVKNYTAGDSMWFLQDTQYGLRPRVVSMYWKSRKITRFKYFVNKDGGEELKILNEKDRIAKKDKIETLEIEDVRHITMLGPDIVLSWGSLEDQMEIIADKKKRFLPVVGLVDHGGTGKNEIRSLAKKLDYLQKFASEILYELRLSIRQVDGSALVWDMANSPKEWLKDGPDAAFKKMNFYLKRDRVQIINSRDKRQNPYASSVNISQKGRIQELMNLLSMIEAMADTITGISSKEQSPYMKATVAEIDYQNTSDRTEEYFGVFDTWCDLISERLLVKAKSVYKEGEVFSFYAGDTNQQFLEIAPEFMWDDLGIFSVDSRKDYDDKKLINDVAGQLFGNAQSPEMMRDLIKIIMADNNTEALAMLDKGIEALNQLKAENDKMMAQSQAEAAKAQQAIEESKERQHKEKLENNIEVTLIKVQADLQKLQQTIESSNLQKAADIEAGAYKDEMSRQQAENEPKQAIMPKE